MILASSTRTSPSGILLRHWWMMWRLCLISSILHRYLQPARNGGEDRLRDMPIKPINHSVSIQWLGNAGKATQCIRP